MTISTMPYFSIDEYFAANFKPLRFAELSSMVEYKNKQGDNMCGRCNDNEDFDLGDFNLVEDELPESNDEYMVIFKNSYNNKCSIATCQFKRQKGWDLSEQYSVLAWQEIDSDISDYMKAMEKKKTA